MATQELVNDFYQFACRQVSAGSGAQSMDEIYLIWRARRPTADELRDSVAAVNAAYADFAAGDRGEPARIVLRETCRELGVAIGG